MDGDSHTDASLDDASPRLSLSPNSRDFASLDDTFTNDASLDDASLDLAYTPIHRTMPP
jgi:hypothetical protein